MNRDEYTVYSFEQESRRSFELSEDGFNEKAKVGFEVEWNECAERCDVLEQLIDEIPMDLIVDNVITGKTKQEFIGILEDDPATYFDCKNFNNIYYFINMTIKNCGDESFYKDIRILRISQRLWNEQFVSSKYKVEKEQRIANGQSIYNKVTVIDGEIQTLVWL
ncbi:hypothetical protein [Clostridium sp.]|uniref:hypothetical protein n=1 Tax=Clostridium sp. TaxID=1506 RepID=UPI001A48E0D9|nr:hypothetical protein [Clostridium sp.]MBK5240255.1 hypothetical protein [Clostridium sp.]